MRVRLAIRHITMEIRKFTEADEDGIRSLFALCFGKELSHEEWSWKYKGSPWGGTAVVAVDGEEIIAHYGGLRMKFRYQDRTFEVFQPCDVMTHPKFRARIFSKKGAMVRAGEYFYATNPMDFAFGFPSERHAILGTRQLGYTEHSYVEVLRREVSWVSPSWNLLPKVEVGWDAIDATELDALCADVRDNSCLSIEKNSSYIFWRYRDNPGKQYLPLIVRSRYGRRLRAFAVLSFGVSGLSILDFFCEKTLRERIILRIFERIASAHDLGSITLWVNPEGALIKTLIKEGFLRGKGVPYIFKVMNNTIKPAFLFHNYCYRMGDYDAS